MKTILIILSIIFVSCQVDTRDSAKVVKVNDGDTFTIDHLSGMMNRRTNIIRLARIDAPELKGKDFVKGIISRDALRSLILGKQIKFHIVTMGKYHRIIGEVYVDDTINVSDWMVRNGYAVYKNYN